jgi:hypothetical protein
MAQIGSLASATSTIFNLDFLPEKLLVGTVAGNQQTNNLSVVTSGNQLFSITANDRVNALAQFDSGGILNITGADSEPASYIKLATGRINKATTITANNPGVSTPAVFAASTNISNVARRAVEQSINPSANATFSTFEALFFDSTNVLRAQITFTNGFSDEYTPVELNAMYANFHIAGPNGTLVGLTCIDADSGAGQIEQVVLYAGSGAAVVVLKTDYVQL